MSGFIGLNVEDRQLPAEVNGYRPSGAYIPNTSFKDTWNVDNAKSLPNTSIGFTTSQRLKFKKNGGNLGFLLTLLKVVNITTKKETITLLTPTEFIKQTLQKRIQLQHSIYIALIGLSLKKLELK